MPNKDDTDIARVLANVFDPFMHIPGTVVRRREVIRLAGKLKRMLGQKLVKRDKAARLLDAMQKITLAQIRLNQTEIGKPPS